jgi:hypothetical protein
MRARARAGLAALRGFVRGFLGLAGPAVPGRLPRDAAGVRRLLAARAARRRSCC